MQLRRIWTKVAPMTAAALLIAAVPVLAAELMGTVKTVKPEEKKIIVVEKESGDEVEVTITEETVLINAKGKQSKTFDLEKFKKQEGKAQVTVVHEDAVASKVTVTPRKKKDADRTP